MELIDGSKYFDTACRWWVSEVVVTSGETTEEKADSSGDSNLQKPSAKCESGGYFLVSQRQRLMTARWWSFCGGFEDVRRRSSSLVAMTLRDETCVFFGVVCVCVLIMMVRDERMMAVSC